MTWAQVAHEHFWGFWWFGVIALILIGETLSRVCGKK